MSIKPNQEQYGVLLRRLVAEANEVPVADLTDAHIESFFARCTQKAAGTHCAYRDPVWAEIEANAMGIIAEVLFDSTKGSRYDSTRSAFGAWCAAVLRHRATDLYRRRRRLRSCEDESLRNLETPESEYNLPFERKLHAANWSREMRIAIDELAWAPAGGQVDYFAVFLLQLRLELTAAVAIYERECTAAPPCMATALLPWHCSEEERPLRQHLPTIGMIWASLATHLDKPPYVDILCATVNQLASCPGMALSSPAWRQWCHRAREAAQQRTGKENWEECFAGWFPQRTARQSGRQEGGRKS